MADLQVVSNIATSGGFVSVPVLALCVNSPDVLGLYPRPELLWGVCLGLLFWLGRVTMLAHRGEMHDDPVVFAATDSASLVCVALSAALAVAAAVA